jgi:hypothetical protein
MLPSREWLAWRSRHSEMASEFGKLAHGGPRSISISAFGDFPSERASSCGIAPNEPRRHEALCDRMQLSERERRATVSSFDGVIRFMASKVRIVSGDSIEFLGPSVSDGVLIEEVYGSQDAIQLF